MNKKYILFDLDGTIIDSKAGVINSIKYSLKSFGINVYNTDDLISFIGPPLRGSYKNYFGFNDEQAENAVTKFREYYSEFGVMECSLYNGIDILLKKQFEQGKTLILATSKVTVYAKQILEHFKVDNYFAFISGSELDGRRSKKSEIIQYAFFNMGITDTQSAVMIGDRKHDIIGANEMGIDSIGVLYGYGNLQELTDAGATFIVENVDSLSELIDRI